MTWDESIRLPSRLSTEPLVQAERGWLLARVSPMASWTTTRACGSRGTARLPHRARWCGWWWSTARRMGILPLSIPNREIREISDLANAVASPAMIIDGGVRSAEHHLPDEIIGQEIMREAEFDFGGLVQLGQLLIR